MYHNEKKLAPFPSCSLSHYYSLQSVQQSACLDTDCVSSRPEAHSECHQPEEPPFYGSSYSYYNVCVAENRQTVAFCLKSCPIMMIYCFVGLLSLHNKEEGITATEGSGIFSCLRVVAPSCILFSNLWQVALYITAHRKLQSRAGIAYSSHKTGKVSCSLKQILSEMRFLRIVAYTYRICLNCHILLIGTLQKQGLIIYVSFI
jgi:hypothetical protein